MNLSKIAEEIRELNNKFTRIIKTPAREDGVVNLNYIDEINILMTSITSAKQSLSEILSEAEEIEASCKKDHENYLKELKGMMEKRGIIINITDGKEQPPRRANGSVVTHQAKIQHAAEKVDSSAPHAPSTDWILVGSAKKKGNAASQQTAPSAWSHPLNSADGKRAITKKAQPPRDGNDMPADMNVSGTSIKYRIDDVAITDKLFIPSVRVIDQLPAMQDIKSGVESGFLYYSLASETFFMILNPGNVLVYGNIGEITPPVDSPRRVKDCKYHPCRYENCCFYHDPFKYPGRSDHRNYIAGSWEYTGAMAGQKRQGEQSRMIGSYGNLDVDVDIVSEQSLDIYGSQIMHDILVYMICKNRA